MFNNFFEAREFFGKIDAVRTDARILKRFEKLKLNELAAVAAGTNPAESVLAKAEIEFRIARVGARATIAAGVISGILGGAVGFGLAKYF